MSLVTDIFIALSFYSSGESHFQNEKFGKIHFKNMKYFQCIHLINECLSNKGYNIIQYNYAKIGFQNRTGITESIKMIGPWYPGRLCGLITDPGLKLYEEYLWLP